MLRSMLDLGKNRLETPLPVHPLQEHEKDWVDGDGPVDGIHQYSAAKAFTYLLPAPVVARSPDRATITTEGLPTTADQTTPGDLRSGEWHGRETAPQLRGFANKTG